MCDTYRWRNRGWRWTNHDAAFSHRDDAANIGRPLLLPHRHRLQLTCRPAQIPGLRSRLFPCSPSVRLKKTAIHRSNSDREPCGGEGLASTARERNWWLHILFICPRLALKKKRLVSFFQCFVHFLAFDHARLTASLPHGVACTACPTDCLFFKPRFTLRYPRHRCAAAVCLACWAPHGGGGAAERHSKDGRGDAQVRAGCRDMLSSF